MKSPLSHLFCLLQIILIAQALPVMAQTVSKRTLATGERGTVGDYTEHAIVNGNPAIAYYDETDKKLRYVRATDANGTSWGAPLVVDVAGDVGQHLSLVVVNGNPAISYYDASNLDLKFVRASDANGAGWSLPLVVDSTGDVGSHTSLAVVNGNPAISYLDGTNLDLKYVTANNADGTVWGAPQTVDSTGDVGTYTCLLVINGNPAVSYYDLVNRDLKYVRASDASGSAWGAPLGVHTTGDVGAWNSLAVVNGNPAISYMGNTNGDFDLVYVRATDASGTTWGTPLTVASLSRVGQFNSLKVVNGNPAISYYHSTNQDLMYVRASNANGTAWTAPLIVDGTNAVRVGSYTSMALVNGNPAISYKDGTNGGLKYVRASDTSGASWSTGQMVDDGAGSGITGEYTSQCMVNDTLAVCYRDGGSTLKYIRATDALGSAWSPPVTVDGSGHLSRYYSMAVVNGNPAISYFDETNGDLMYVRANDASGNSWGAPQIVDGALLVGLHTSLAVVNGNPAISYHHFNNKDLKYVRAMDASGTAWGTPQIVDNSFDVGEFTSLEVINGNPAISYYDESFRDLKFVRATDASGTAWGAPQVVDSGSDVGRFTSLAVVDGNPAISYYDDTNLNLKYVRASNASGTTWAAPLTVDSTGDVGSHTSLEVVDGRPAISYLDGYASVINLDLKYVSASDASGTAWNTPQILDSTGTVGEYNSLAVLNGNPAISYFDSTHGDLKWQIMIYPDADKDSLLDSWELTQWPSTTGHGPLDDDDHDGLVNLLELAFGLNPTVPNAGALTPLTQEGGYLTMTISKQPGVTYEVQSAGTLLPSLPDSFSAGSTTVLINDATTLKVRDNTLFGTPPARFMRVQVTGAP